MHPAWLRIWYQLYQNQWDCQGLVVLQGNDTLPGHLISRKPVKTSRFLHVPRKSGGQVVSAIGTWNGQVLVVVLLGRGIIEPYQATKEQKMQNQLTVAQLIAILQALPNQNALVEMAMNQEYQAAVEADDIHVWSDDLVIIGE